MCMCVLTGCWNSNKNLWIFFPNIKPWLVPLSIPFSPFLRVIFITKKVEWNFIFKLDFLFFFFFFFRAAPVAYGTSWARGQISEATRDSSHICNIHHSSWQCWIPNPLSKVRDWTQILMDNSQIRFLCATTGTTLTWFSENHLMVRKFIVQGMFFLQYVLTSLVMVRFLPFVDGAVYGFEYLFKFSQSTTLITPE